MADRDIWREWKNGRNTFEIGRALNMTEAAVMKRLHATRDALLEKKERDRMYRKYFSASRKKFGFTGRETVAGYPRGRV